MVLYIQRSFSSLYSKHFHFILRQQQQHQQHQLRRGVTLLQKPYQQSRRPLVTVQRNPLPPSTCCYRLTKINTHSTPSFQLQTRRTFAWWKIPLALMKTGKKQKIMALATAVGGSTILGFFFGPISFLIISTLFGGLAWRIWRQTSKWWQYLPSPNVLNNNPLNTDSLYSAIRSLVGQHRAEDNVRQLAIQQIKRWAHTEEGRNALLYDFNVSHSDDLTFLPTHARATYTTVKSSVDRKTSKENTTTLKEVDIQFLIEAMDNDGSDGGGCMVDTKALIDSDSGNIALKNIRLSSPGWTMDKYLPLDNQENRRKYRVIEGEFKDV